MSGTPHDTSRAALYTARWVLPVSSPPIRDAAVLVDADGHIAAVGPADTLDAPEHLPRIDLGEAALLPGLVNTHAHPELALFRGYLEDLPFHEWIPALMAGKRDAGLEPDDYRAAALWTCVEALATGTTTLAATEDSGAALHALATTGMRGTVYREVFGPAPDHAEHATAGLRDKITAMRHHETERVRVGVSPHAPYSVSDRLYQATADLATELGLPVATHAAEAAAEHQLVRRGRGPFAEALHRRGIETPPRADSTIALLERTGLLATRPLLIHCVLVDDSDIRRIADAGASVAHCPIANARLGHGIAPVTELRAQGIAVGLGTDSVASNNRIDMLEEARVAQLLQRASRKTADALPPRTLLRMATLDGARALGLDHRIGSLEPGKSADLCAISLATPAGRPVHDVHAALAMAARGADVVLSAVEGRVLYRDGRWTTVEVDAVRRRLEEAAARLPAARDVPSRGVPG